MMVYERSLKMGCKLTIYDDGSVMFSVARPPLERAAIALSRKEMCYLVSEWISSQKLCDK